jgi:hypothetical protein
MIRLIQAVIRALRNMIVAGGSAMLQVWDELFKTLAKFGGGGGSGIAAPEKDITAAMPSFDQLDHAKELAAGDARAVEHLVKLSPAQQVKMFASMSEADRMTADLSLLSEAQFDWVHRLSDGQLKVINDTSDRRVAAALSGEPGQLLGTKSVGEIDEEPETALGYRLAAARAGTLSTSPVYIN